MVEIREMQEKDIDSVYDQGIRESRFRVSKDAAIFWSKEQLIKWINSESDILLVAEDNDKIVGYVLSQHHVATGKATIENVYVDSEYRKQKIAFKLVEKCVGRLKEKGASYFVMMVEQDNEPMLKASESMGFTRGKDYVWIDKFVE